MVKLFAKVQCSEHAIIYMKMHGKPKELFVQIHSCISSKPTSQKSSKHPKNQLILEQQTQSREPLVFPSLFQETSEESNQRNAIRTEVPLIVY